MNADVLTSLLVQFYLSPVYHGDQKKALQENPHRAIWNIHKKAAAFLVEAETQPEEGNPMGCVVNLPELR